MNAPTSDETTDVLANDEPSELWPAGLSATLHLTDHRHVACYDLPGGSVSLVLGDRDANVTMVGSIDHFMHIATAILDELAAVQKARKAAGQ